MNLEYDNEKGQLTSFYAEKQSIRNNPTKKKLLK